MAGEYNKLTDVILSRLSEEFLKFLQEQFQDDDIYEAIRPLIPAVLDLAKAEGIEAAEMAVRGLLFVNSYEHWKSLISASTPDHRILIMEHSRQQGIQDALLSCLSFCLSRSNWLPCGDRHQGDGVSCFSRSYCESGG